MGDLIDAPNSVDDRDTVETETETGNDKKSNKNVEVAIPAVMKKNLMEYIRLDDDIKVAAGQLKVARNESKLRKSDIFDWMCKNDVPILKMKKKNAILIIREQEVKLKPTQEQQNAKLMELITNGVRDATTIFSELRKCGSVTTEKRLYRRKFPKKDDAENSPSKKKVKANK